MRSRRSRPKSDINITPMIDVLLVLLVIFMVITPLESTGLQTNIPQSATANTPTQPDEALILAMDASGSLRINKEELSLTALTSRLQEIFRTRADRTLFVQADDELLFDDVARLVDIAVGAGATRVGLLTEPLSDQR
jgi:biopolymer transport protein TolR